MEKGRRYLWGVQKGGERCSSATWTLAVDGGRRSPKRQRPPKQERRRVGVSLRQSTSRHPLLRGAHPPIPAASPCEAGRDVAYRRKDRRGGSHWGVATRHLAASRFFRGPHTAIAHHVRCAPVVRCCSGRRAGSASAAPQSSVSRRPSAGFDRSI